jgi:hypothetical protein
MAAIYGMGDFSKIKFSGKYRVGHKTIYISKLGAPVSVFYPIDEKDYDYK